MKRSPLKRSTKRIAPRSAKRIAEAPKRRAVKSLAMLRADGRCEARDVLDHDCEGPLDAHELIPRSEYPGGHLDQRNVIIICRVAHDWVHDHPKDAYRVGLLKHSWERNNSPTTNKQKGPNQ